MDQRHVPRGLLSVPLTALLACGYGAGGMPSAAGSEELPEGRGVRLDRDVIVHAAQRVLDEDGLTGLTLRRIGNELGADPTAIYRHFRDKDELVTELADRAFTAIPAPDPALPWQERLRRVLRGGLELYRANPDFAFQLAVQPDDTPGLQRIAETILGALAEAGLGPRDRAIVYQLMTNYAVGSGLFISQLVLDGWGPEEIPAVRRTYAALPPEQYPHCVESAPFLFPDQDDVYDMGVDMLVGAIESFARSRAAPDDEPSNGATGKRRRE
jgi:AcrR family transcriptional regulator